MNMLRNIARLLTGALLVLVFGLGLAIQVPAVQRWMGSQVGHALSQKVGSPVSVGRVELALNGRIVVQDLGVRDRRGDTLLQASRVAARLSLWPLLHGQVRIGNAQLFGAQVHLSQEHPDSATNFQYLVDAFSSNDTTSNSQLDLHIGQLLVRRTSVNWDQKWKPQTPGRFNAAHVHLSDVNLTAELNAIRPDSQDIEIKRLEARDHSGLQLTSLKTRMKADRHGIHLSDFSLGMPGSQISIPQASLSKEMYGEKRLPATASAELQGYLSTADLAPLLPVLGREPLTARLNISATLQQGTLTISQLSVSEQRGMALLQGQATLSGLDQGGGALHVRAQLEPLTAELQMAKPYIEAPILDHLGRVTVRGPIEWSSNQVSGKLNVQTTYGQVSVEGLRRSDGWLEAEAHTESLHLKDLLQGTAQVPVTNVWATAQVKGNPKEKMDVRLGAVLVEVGATQLRNIQAEGTIAPHAKRHTASLNVADPNLQVDGEALVDLRNKQLQTDITVSHIDPHALALSKNHEGETYSARLHARLRADDWHNPEGIVHLNALTQYTATDTLRMGDMHLTSRPQGKERHMTLVSPWLEVQVDGLFKSRYLTDNIMNIVHDYAPMLNAPAVPETSADDWVSVQLRLYDATPIRRMAGISLSNGRPITLQAQMNAGTNTLLVELNAPDASYGNEHLQNVAWRMEANPASMLSSLQLQRAMRDSNVDIRLETTGHDHLLNHKLSWDNNQRPAMRGMVNIENAFRTAPDGKTLMLTRLMPSDITVADSLWQVEPGSLSYHDQVLTIDSLHLHGGQHSIALWGTASKLPSDTIHANLQDIDLKYIFSFINFDAVEMQGQASGHVVATQLFSQPSADAWLRLPHFMLNGADMGLLNIYGNWNSRQAYSIYIDGVLTDLDGGAGGLVSGYITPKKDISYHGIDLDIRADHLNAGFINKYTEAIFDRMEGRASGWARLFGPFKALNIEGDLNVDEGSLGVPFVGVRYHLQNDSIHLRPGTITFQNATLYDPQGGPGVTGHCATVNGRLEHNHFSDLRYDIDIQGQNMLAYDLGRGTGFGFWGHVLADGRVTITGEPGRIDIDIQASPLRGTTFTYDITTPGYLRENTFVEYTPQLEPPPLDSLATIDPATLQTQEQASIDMHINFDLDITSQAQMNILMDAKAGDMITVDGDGRIRAQYYNKGGFEIYGTYRINRGVYGLTLQNIIRKDFTLTNGSTITFAGNPMEGQLNVRATHTVTGVSLNDLSARASFSNSAARVNCIMDITGQANQPHIAFDFDILNVNDDEKQMIRSLISTEEERNMQVMYLLGVGRFYAYSYQDQSQGSTMMNSLLSSTLSGQLNQMFQNIIGHRNWNIGANLNTGEEGWSDIDVEGAVQGSLLDNRLLINGNFGYRDNQTNVKQNNFVGDFDVQYHLTSSGNVSLKAYSETNDRYFTKSSLTTQGVGVVLKKDFKNMKDLFSVRRKRKKEKDTTPEQPPATESNNEENNEEQQPVTTQD